MNRLLDLLGRGSNKNELTPLGVQTKIIKFSPLKTELQSKLKVGNTNNFRTVLVNLFDFPRIYNEGDNSNHLDYTRRYNQEKDTYYDISKAEQFILNRGGKKETLHQQVKAGLLGNKTKTNKVSILNITEIDTEDLFEIQSLYIQDGYYIFITRDGGYYHVGKNDFDKNGVLASSLSFGKFLFNDNDKKAKNFHIEQEIGQVSIIKKGESIGKILGDHAIVVDENTGDLIIINDNIFEYRNIDKKGKISITKSPQRHPYGTINQIKKDINCNFVFLVSEHSTKNKLHILNRKDLSEIKTIDDIDHILGLDSDNNLICKQTNGDIIGLHTNLEHFPKSYVDHMKVVEVQVEELQQNSAQRVGDIIDVEIPDSIQIEDIDSSDYTGKKTPGDILNKLRELKSNFNKETSITSLIQLQKDIARLEEEKTKSSIQDAQLDESIDDFKNQIWSKLSSYNVKNS